MLRTLNKDSEEYPNKTVWRLKIVIASSVVKYVNVLLEKGNFESPAHY